ncbi:type II toxin-antitoxin system VapC family toxin [Mucilaginibacter sp. X4EP1]|uniref:type II toxin-antitoxin system VapC family toxin n=1 Tax=Mucilaginibacter sp. X4EP1 TaxID=2723092 RepID=UPI00216896A8|nr:PIN domain-containing protein [Mucilaginibacter sp. X4EP1]MCS3816145.1 putative nucleic acid-binding protein [Mucilaginibacter sp. X4EP1]
MKNLFVDTNILMDLIADRQPFSKFAIELFELAEKKRIKLYTSSHSYATTHYLLKKYLSEKELREILLSLLDFVTIIPIDFAVIKKSLLSQHKDFEDAIQIFAANTITTLDFIVTRNLKDFKDTGITVLPPDEVLRYL